ncbi:o-succinylbenzoic acid (OSB) synthetase [Nitritalea halalkaliphila LW7]|uniref:O-succinylbenzoic acid (OSB) synthetase n=1 Tax=Nitritalea halalkaliphila LW7 TaxID=1189621 RepID=I5C9Q6_9BACT|nr:o-succinylbenzoate synthase [Nitritalea halalkaliphila]EIM78558.1 o-succinylbenzoic acid (OSB) synthetase [Nitritalea halalkaliphila LW7]
MCSKTRGILFSTYLNSIYGTTCSRSAPCIKLSFRGGNFTGDFAAAPTWWIHAQDGSRRGIGEAAPLVGLSIDALPDFQERLEEVLEAVSAKGDAALFRDAQTQEEVFEGLQGLLDACVPAELPAARFGVETALLSLWQGKEGCVFRGSFYEKEAPIPINGLIWMGDAELMRQRIDEKLAAGFRCLKMKIGAIDFEQELALLRYIRERFPAEQLVLRVDANGAFRPEEAAKKLERLAEFTLHSIEQPIAVGQWELLRELCAQSPVPIALDEELIGVHGRREREELLAAIRPPYIILKPSLVGGMGAAAEWISLAEQQGIGWWMTSALESNVGLNAIAQFTARYPNLPYQGLGTGQLYTNNVNSPLEIAKGEIRYRLHQLGEVYSFKWVEEGS